MHQTKYFLSILCRINDDAMTLTSFQSNDDSQDDNNNRVGIVGKRGQRDKWLLFPTKTIYEMITSTQVSIYMS